MMIKTLAFILTLTGALAARADVQSAQCFPSSADASDWPIRAIYLHGLFTAPPGTDNGFRALESSNRQKLASIAQTLKIKIAVPLAPAADDDTHLRSWNQLSLSQIESAARSACGGQIFAGDGLAFIGFSNGAIWAAKHLDCSNTAQYAKVLVIGAQGSGGPQQGRCGGRFIESAPHVFPGLDLKTELSFLAGLQDQPLPTIRLPAGLLNNVH